MQQGEANRGTEVCQGQGQCGQGDLDVPRTGAV